MFDNEEDDLWGGEMNEDIKMFESFLEGGDIGFLDSDRWEALIDHYIISGNYKKAEICAEEALSQFSFQLQFKLRKAQAQSGQGKLKEALNGLNEIEKSGFDNFELFYTKGAIFSQLKDSKSAIRYYKMALSVSDDYDKDDVFLELAIEYQNKGDFKLALNVLHEALKDNPTNEAAVYEMAHCYERLGRDEDSVKCFSDYIDNNPYSFTAWYNLGNAYLRLEQYERAIWAYDYSLLINEDFGPVYFNLGNAYLNLEKYTKAIESFLKCLDLDGDDPVAICYLGECHEQLNELELAKHYYRMSLELAPSFPDAWLGLGIVKDLEGETTEGITLILKALELDPENAGICHVLAGAYEKLDARVEAAGYYERSLSLDPFDEECLTDYIIFLKEEGNPEAFSYLEEFEENNNETRRSQLLKIELWWSLGRSEEALNLFKKCLEEDKENALELFEVYPALKNVTEFVLLADQ